MIRQVEWTKRALKQLGRLDRPTQKRILEALDSLAEDSRGDVRRLQGIPGEPIFRLRVGNWRVIFSLQQSESILVLSVKSRSGAYNP